MTRDGNFKRRVRQQARAIGERYTKVLADRRLVDAQRAYYDRRAPDYGDVSVADRKGGGMMTPALMESVIAELAPTGDVLELACGPGGFTELLATRSRSLTAVDGSATMLERSRGAVGEMNVTYVQADLFDWEPVARYDFVFFGFWLSHVPPSHFDSFWSMVRACLRPDGRVGFVDEDQRAGGHDDLRVVNGTPVATRQLRDGVQYDIVKVFWEPSDLEGRLRTLGWNMRVYAVGETYLLGQSFIPSG